MTMGPEWKRQYCPRTWVAELKSMLFWRDVFVEFLVTTILMIFVMLVVITNNPSHYTPNTTHFGLFAGFLVYLLIEGYGPFCGALMNPAATFALGVTGHISPFRALVYILAEVCGTAAAAGLGYSMTPDASRSAFHALVPAATMTDGQSVLVEACLTFNLLFVAISVSDAKSRPCVTLPALPVGFCLGIGIMVAGTHTGGFQNPLVPLGPAIVTGNFSQHWIYWVGPILGGTLGALFYELLQKYTRHFTPVKTVNTEDKNSVLLDAIAKKEELTKLLEEIIKDASSKEKQFSES